MIANVVYKSLLVNRLKQARMRPYRQISSKIYHPDLNLIHQVSERCGIGDEFAFFMFRPVLRNTCPYQMLL